jgi:hypothetical protein
MPHGVTRRQLLTHGIMAGIGLAVTPTLNRASLILAQRTGAERFAPNVFRPADDPSDADRITFDTFANGQAMRMNYSGIEFFRAFTPRINADVKNLKTWLMIVLS